MNDLNELLKQAQQMQARLVETQSKLNEIEVTGSAGGGMVAITINGKHDFKKVFIDPKLMLPDEVEILCDLITAAYGDAKNKLESKITQEMGGLLPDSLKLPPM
ncbi:MAG: YbaB/EbfC family nucleoid-associated protein [Holosporaceae bacterium]|jgi:DNA-binding YbaB/EbfC family protein|nr:YbaB/EbfC family nucleoid-associated protein [Holosporaceae bacterium]